MYILMHTYTYIVTIHNKHIPYISNQTKKYLSPLKPWSRVRVHMYIPVSLTYSTHGRESNILTMHILQLRRWTSNMCIKFKLKKTDASCTFNRKRPYLRSCVKGGPIHGFPVWFLCPVQHMQKGRDTFQQF